MKTGSSIYEEPSSGISRLLFNVEFDRKGIIEGYLIPDGFSDQSSILVTRDDGTVVSFPCDQPRPAVVQSGRHATGIVGFRIDESRMPDLASQRRLAIQDARTGLLIYRRPPVDEPVELKLLRLELNIVPMAKFDAYCGGNFQYAISAVERFGHETTMQAFHLHAHKSIYISGRLLLRNYEEFLDNGFQAIADVPDPYYEMACRLFILKRLAKGPVTFLGDRDRLILTPASEHFAEVNLDDDKAVNRALKKASDKARSVLISPITRQLVCTYPEQRVTRRDIAAAIGTLSRFKVVGHEGDHAHFQQAIGELLSLPPMNIPVIPRYSLLEELAMRLRQMPVAESMLEEDLILDHYVRQAMVPSAQRTGKPQR